MIVFDILIRQMSRHRLNL